MMWGKLWNEHTISREIKRMLYYVKARVVYVFETGSGKIKPDLFEMMCLRNICGIRKGKEWKHAN